MDGNAMSPSSEMVLTFQTSWTTGPSSDKDALKEKFWDEFTRYIKEEDLKKAIESDDMKSKYGNFTVMKIASALDGVTTPTNSPTTKSGKKSKTKKTSKTQAPTTSPTSTKTKAGKNKTGKTKTGKTRKTTSTSAPTTAKGNKGTKTKAGKRKGRKIA